jgi:maltose-binding protein MalE
MALVIAVLLSGVLAGCSSSGEVSSSPTPPAPTATSLQPTLPPLPVASATRPQAQKQVIIWSAWDPLEIRTLRRIIEDFVAGNPGYSFSLVYFPPDQLLEAFLSCSENDGCPDLVFGASSWAPRLVGEGRVVDVSGLIDSQLQRDLFPVAWQLAVLGDVMAGLPLELQGIVLFRNSALVSRQSSNLAGLIEQANALRESTKAPSVFDFGFYQATPMIAACGVSFFSPTGAVSLPAQEGRCWLELLRQWGASGRVVLGGDEDLQAFISGESGWLIEPSLSKQALERAVGIQSLVVDPWPVYQETGQALKGYVWSENVYISSNLSQTQLEASWTFARFLFSAQAQTALSDVFGPAHIPALQSVTLVDPVMQAISEMLRSGMPLPLRSDMERVIAPIESAISDVVLQGADPTQALNVAADRLKSLGEIVQTEP